MSWRLIKNYKLQNTNYKQITNHKLQITNKMAHELHELPRIEANSNEKLLQGVRMFHGAVFSKRAPLANRAKSLQSKYGLPIGR